MRDAAEPAGPRLGTQHPAGRPVSLSTSATRRAFCKSGIRNATEDDIGAFGIAHAGKPQ